MLTTQEDEERLSTDDRVLIQTVPKRTWRGHIWDTLDKSAEERRFLFKLDSAVLTFATLGYFIKYLDQANIKQRFCVWYAERSRTLRKSIELPADFVDGWIRYRSDTK